MTRRGRLTVILGLAAALFFLVLAIQIIGAQRVDREARRVDALAKTVHLDPRQHIVSADSPRPFATALQLPLSALAVVYFGPEPCAVVRLERLAATRHRFFSVQPDGSLRRESTCARH